jgi:hypothetical protein
LFFFLPQKPAKTYAYTWYAYTQKDSEFVKWQGSIETLCVLLFELFSSRERVKKVISVRMSPELPKIDSSI